MQALDGGFRRNRWVPPARPDWLRIVNEEGSHFHLPSVVPLDERSLIETAMANTGLDDFGDENWREPFSVLIRSLEHEANLNLMGRLMTRSDLLITLEARLQVEAAYKAHPEIDEEVITQPLIIIGQGRSGTSMLQNALCEDPANGTIRNWEALFPCPPPESATYDSDSRADKADALTGQWNRVAPTIESMHEFNGRVPTESIHLHCMSFRSMAWFDLMGQTPSYAMYMMEQDPAEPYRYEKRVLKLLQWHNPRRTWVMKSPVTITHLPAVLDVYPDAGFIWTHRDPVKAMASVVNLIGTLHWMRSDEPFQRGSLAQFTNSDQAARTMDRAIGWLESGELPRTQLCNVAYPDLVRDPIGTIAQIYEFFDLELTPDGRAAIEDHLRNSARSNRPAHAYELGSDDEIQLERAAFKAYQEYFNVKDEI